MYNVFAGAQTVSECIACDPGYYCLYPGWSNVTMECMAGYYCTREAEFPNPTGKIYPNDFKYTYQSLHIFYCKPKYISYFKLCLTG